MSREIVRAHDLLGMMNSPGWRAAAEIAEQLIQRTEKDALACDEEDKIVGLQREARVARKFWNDLQNVMRSTTQIDDAGLAGSL
jgi:hypothetical protein